MPSGFRKDGTKLGFKKGFRHTEESKRKMSKSRMGHPNYLKGHSEETKKMMSERMKGNKYSVGVIPWNKGKGKYPNGRDPIKEKLRVKKYRERGWQAVYLRNTRAKRKLAEGSFTVGEWENLKKQYGFRCPSCLKIEPEIKLSIDHIIPLSLGGSNYIENIQPLCVPCNVKKHTKIIKYEI